MRYYSLSALTTALNGRVGRLTAGNALYAAGQWLTLVFVSRGLGLEALGYFSFALAVTAPIMLLAGMSLRTVYQSQWEIASLRAFLTLRVLLSVTGLVIVACLTLFSSEVPPLVLMALALAKSFDLIGDLAIGILLHRGFANESAAIPALNGFLTATLVWVAITVWGTLNAAACASAFASFVASVLTASALLLRLGVFKDRPRPASGKWMPIVFVALPLGLAATVTSLSANIPRYVIEQAISIEAVGTFTAILSLIYLFHLPIQAMQQADLSRAATLVRSNDHRGASHLLRRDARFALAVGVLIVVVAAAIGQSLLDILYGAEFPESQSFFVLLAVASVPAAVIWVADLGLWSYRLGRSQLAINVFTAIAVLALSLALIPRYGMSGAAVAIGVSGAMQLVIKGLRLRKAVSSQSASRP